MSNIAVVFNEAERIEGSLNLCPDVNLYTGKKEFNKEFGELTSLEEDLLVVGASIFAADIATKRGQHHNFIRGIELMIPVVNLPVFENVVDDIRYALHLLSSDAWTINFTQRDGLPEKIRNKKARKSGKVLLFSGGLDSFAAAVLLAQRTDQVQLVSHVTANRVISGTQDCLEDYLKKRYADKFSRLAFRVTGYGKPTKSFPFPQDQDREETQRTRSFMFLCLAGLVARRLSFQDVVMIAENGQMAIHLPLSAGRISAFSTHTAHPEFVSVMSEILSKILRYEIKIENPFIHMTKAEVVKLTLPDHKDILDQTVSCWKASRVSNFHHCGICVPCLIRRIALESNNIFLPECERDLLRENISELSADDDGKRNLVDLCEFISHFKANHSLAELQVLFPELATASYDVKKVVKMYKNFAAEAMAVFENYPEVRKTMG